MEHAQAVVGVYVRMWADELLGGGPRFSGCLTL